MRHYHFFAVGLFLAFWFVFDTSHRSANAQAAAGKFVRVNVVTNAEGWPRFDPPIVFIQPGDSVEFALTGHVHASRVIPEMRPNGAAGWWGQVGQNVVVVFDQQGVYGHKCGASYSLGLVGLVVVGDANVNLATAKTVQHPPAAAAVFADLFDEVDERLKE